MTVDVRELLPLYAVGLCEPDERAAVEAALARDPVLAAELAELDDAAALIGGAAPSVAPSAHVKARLMTAVGGGRFEKLATRFGAIFDTVVERTRELLAMAENPSSWIPSGMPGIQAIHFAGGPAVAGADTGFLYLQPGAQFAWHRHIGDELTLVLSGRIRDHDGTLYVAGDEVPFAGGTEHDFVCEGDEPALLAVRVYGVQYGLIKPTD
jgi:anti-sigma factor ChrR (cupin superfamily)